MKRTQALRCPRMSLSHLLSVLMIRRMPFRCHPAATPWACPTSPMPEHHCPPRVTFWCLTPPFLVCCIHASFITEKLGCLGLGIGFKCHIRLLKFFFWPRDLYIGYVSWRDTQSGSWYIETLDRILEENASTDDLVTMLMMVRCSYFDSWMRFNHVHVHFIMMFQHLCSFTGQPWSLPKSSQRTVQTDAWLF